MVVAIDGHYLDVTIPVPGEHMVYSVLCAAQIGMLYGLTDEEIIDGIKAMNLLRCEWINSR